MTIIVTSTFSFETHFHFIQAHSKGTLSKFFKVKKHVDTVTTSRYIN